MRNSETRGKGAYADFIPEQADRLHEQDDYRLIHYLKAQAAYAGVSLVVLVLQEDMAQVQHRLRDTQKQKKYSSIPITGYR